jgi:hypothetical protein
MDKVRGSRRRKPIGVFSDQEGDTKLLAHLLATPVTENIRVLVAVRAKIPKNMNKKLIG